MSVPTVPGSNLLAEIAGKHISPAQALQREALLRQVLPLWGRVIPDETMALVVALTAEISTENFTAALLGFARSSERMSWENPIPILLAEDRKLRSAAVAAEEERKREASKVEAVPMPAAVRERLARMGLRIEALTEPANLAREGSP